MDINELKKSFRLDGSGRLQRVNVAGNWHYLNEKADNYTEVQLNKKRDRVHRIVWQLSNNANIPDGMVIDHIDNNKGNNLPSNLQLTTYTVNVTKDRKYKLPKARHGKYGLFFRKAGKMNWIGTYATPELYWSAHAIALKGFHDDVVT